jgi:CrcB protein
MDRFVMVFVGAGAGGLARFIAGTVIMQRYAGRFPLGTFLINVSGSFLIGVLMAFLSERLDLSPNWRLLLVVGFLGGYTTFSSFEYETFVAVRSGSQVLALLNILGSIVFGYIAVWLGAIIGARLALKG